MWTGAYLSGRVWAGKKKSFFFDSYINVSLSLVRRTAQNALQSALHFVLLSSYIGMCVFHERQRDICRRRA